MKSNPTSLYIHIPFCKSLCSYCDFKKVIYNQKMVDKYFESLFFDLDQFPKKHYETIYIGGGTPSSVDSVHLKQLLTACRELLKENYIEFAIESNVEDLTDEFLNILQTFGVNRLSIGVQTFNSDFIKYCNRHHTKEMAIRNVIKASNYITNISIDMIYGFKNQTIENLSTEIEIIKTLPIKHISYYSLLIEENTALWTKGEKNIPDDVQARMYRYIVKSLKNIGFKRYEISNFAISKAYESAHNKVYWHNKEYDAAGIAASGYKCGKRYKNITNIIKYMNGDRTLNYLETIDKKEMMFEEIMLRLRLDEGLNIEKFDNKYRCNFEEIYKTAINENLKNKLIKINDGYLKATMKGSLLLNSVLELFLEDNDKLIIS